MTWSDFATKYSASPNSSLEHTDTIFRAVLDVSSLYHVSDTEYHTNFLNTYIESGKH